MGRCRLRACVQPKKHPSVSEYKKIALFQKANPSIHFISSPNKGGHPNTYRTLHCLRPRTGKRKILCEKCCVVVSLTFCITMHSFLSTQQVGSTTNRKRRIQEHIRRRGSKWTREHKPIKVLQEYRRIPSKYIFGMESQITAECMLKFGVNNVRGSMFCSTREFHLGDVDSLTKFLGHYNDLRYKKVSARLLQTLPPAPRRYKTSNNGKCFSCGKFGHFAANCPEKKEDSNVFM
jgi:predicted GIY-YIG superfamily endonuclease